MRNFFRFLIAVAMVSSLGMLGCKNVCQKAADKAMGCMEAFCSENSEHPRCASESLAGLQAGMGAAAADCSPENATQGETWLNQSCDDILQTLGFRAP